MSDWRHTTIGDVLTFQRGFDITRDVQRPGSVPIVSSGGISSYHDTAMVSGPGVVIGRKGTLGKTFFLPGEYWPHDTTLWVRDFKGSDPRFVYYFMSRFETAWLDAGSANPTLNRNHLHPLAVDWPDVSTQRAIAEVLGALDDKIAANTRVTETIARLLPMTFRRVFKGVTEFVPLGCLVKVMKGVSYRSADLAPSSTALVTLKSVGRDGQYAERGLKAYTGPFKPDQEICPGDIVVAQTDLTQAADVVGRAVRVPISRAFRKLVASLDLCIVRPTTNMSKEFLLGVLADESFRAHCCSHTSGTTVLHLKSGAIESYAAPSVAPDVQDRYSELSRPVLELGEQLNQESMILATLRDTLLPQLMSGKLRVKDAEQQVEAVV